MPLVVSAGFGVWCVVALRSMWVRVLGAYAVGAAVGLLVERFDLPFAVIIGLLGMGVGARAAWRLRRG